ncbi:MAG: diguanylate cyclase [Desulfobacterales bacterium]|nr:MAG: diguanylate cyclase [Desulfobacterales bacterium]
MRLNFRKKDDEGRDEAQDLSARLADSEARKNFFLLAIRALLLFIREFVCDIKEIESEEFKKELSALADKFTSEPKLKSIQSFFEKDKKIILSYIRREKDYLRDREKEFRDIIDLLTKALVTLDSENQVYNQTILAQSEKIEQIMRLDDIKKLKQELQLQVEQIRETVKDKQVREHKQLDVLSRQVNSLSSELKKARTESLQDGLTGIYNRKAFDRFLGELVEKNTLAKAPFAMLLLDIDNFKAINDTYGHQTGDRVLLASVNKCRDSIRHDDFLARYGGEEFVIVLPGASVRNAIRRAKQICKTIASTRYALEDYQRGQTLKITVSIGVSAYHKGDTATTILDRADQALYVAKRSGKNRVVSERDLV